MDWTVLWNHFGKFKLSSLAPMYLFSMSTINLHGYLENVSEVKRLRLCLDYILTVQPLSMTILASDSLAGHATRIVIITSQYQVVTKLDQTTISPPRKYVYVGINGKRTSKLWQSNALAFLFCFFLSVWLCKYA